jgi:hypothetical protein
MACHLWAGTSEPSCPALCRASTPFFLPKKQGVDGRDKPGHDEMTRRYA